MSPFPGALRRALALACCLSLTGFLGARQENPAPAAEDAAGTLVKEAKELWEAWKMLEAEQAYLQALREYGKQAPQRAGEAAFQLKCDACRNLLGELQTQMYKFREAKAFFEDTAQHLQKCSAAFPAEPGFAIELARTHSFLASNYRQAALVEEAAQEQKQGISLLRKVVADKPANGEARLNLVNLLTNHAGACMELGRYAESDAAYRAAVEAGRKLAADFPDKPEYQMEFACAWNAHAYLQRESGQIALAARSIREAIRILTRLEERYPGQPQHWRMLPTTYRNLAQALSFLGQISEEAAAKREALRLDAKLAAIPGAAGRPFTTGEKIRACIQDRDVRRLADLGDEVNRYYLEMDQLARAHPEVPLFAHERITGKMSLGLAALDRQAFPEARAHFQEAQDLQQKLVVAYPEVLMYRKASGTHSNLTGIMTYLASGSTPEAEQYLRSGFGMLEKLADEHPRSPKFRLDLSNAYCSLAMVKISKGNQAEGIRHLEQSGAELKKLAESFPDCPQYRREHALSHLAVGKFWVAAGGLAEAEAAYREGIRLWTINVSDFPAIPDFRRDTGSAYTDLGMLLARREKIREAEEAYARAVQVFQRLLDEKPDEDHTLEVLAGVHACQGRLFSERGQWAAALEYNSRCLACLDKALRINPRQRGRLSFLKDAVRERAFLCQRLDDTPQYQANLNRMEEIDELLEPTNLRLMHVGQRFEEGNPARALKNVEDLLDNSDLSGAEFRELAAVLARGLEKVQDPAPKETVAADAVRALQKAGEKGTRGVTPLREDPQFHALSSRPDFQKVAAGEDGSK